jgi:hypothetical protein
MRAEVTYMTRSTSNASGKQGSGNYVNPLEVGEIHGDLRLSKQTNSFPSHPSFFALRRSLSKEVESRDGYQRE